MVNTIKCTVLAKEDDILGYKTIVVKNLDDSSFGKLYFMLVIFPNWQSTIPEIGETGFLTYDFVSAGDTYFDRMTDSFKKYNFTNLVFIKFVKEQDTFYLKDIII